MSYDGRVERLFVFVIERLGIARLNDRMTGQIPTKILARVTLFIQAYTHSR